ncbi:plasmid mobilization relaxosome protein MobC, partial [Enterococcus faecalis]
SLNALVQSELNKLIKRKEQS